MKKYIPYISKILTALAIFIAVALFGVSAADAKTPPRLEVDFEPDPLFGTTDFLPNDETAGTVTVTNNSGTAQDVIAEAINVYDDEGFGDVLRLEISENGSSIYNNTLGQFLSSGELPLSGLSDGVSTSYSFAVTFDETLLTDGNQIDDYQAVELGFDLCVGFEGEEGLACGDTVIGGDDDDGGTITGSGGGGGGVLGPLAIRDEQATVNPQAGETVTILITWLTNYFSTSQVVYSAATEPHTFVLYAPPKYGYANIAPDPEDANKVTFHTVPLAGLKADTVYYYRTISRASPPTISRERVFTTPPASYQPSEELPPEEESKQKSEEEEVEVEKVEVLGVELIPADSDQAIQDTKTELEKVKVLGSELALISADEVDIESIANEDNQDKANIETDLKTEELEQVVQEKTPQSPQKAEKEDTQKWWIWVLLVIIAVEIYLLIIKRKKRK